MLSLSEYIAKEEQIIIDEEERKSELRSQISEFFKNTEEVNDEKFHSFAETLGVDPHDAENVVYEMINACK